MSKLYSEFVNLLHAVRNGAHIEHLLGTITQLFEFLFILTLVSCLLVLFLKSYKCSKPERSFLGTLYVYYLFTARQKKFTKTDANVGLLSGKWEFYHGATTHMTLKTLFTRTPKLLRIPQFSSTVLLVLFLCIKRSTERDFHAPRVRSFFLPSTVH